MDRARFRRLLAPAVSVLIALSVAGAMLVAAAEADIDLDENPTNGDESRVVTRVMQSFPVEVENIIYNNTDGKSFRFRWPGAGPGGFDSELTAGPGVGIKWEWSTVSQVYSIQSPATFTPASRGLPVFGNPPGGIRIGDGPDARTFLVPGKSIFPTDVTVSSASLTSSLITFFSPEETLATCESSFTPGRFEQTIENNSGDTLTLTVGEPGCCPEPQMINCQGDCFFYKTDPANCGGCGIECAFDEFCGDGVCTPICPGQALCGEECVDLLTDPDNCGGCGVQCAFDEFCGDGVCTPICPGQTLCGETCVDLLTDSSNCGACGVQCDALYVCVDGMCEPDCPPGQALCGEECVDLQTDSNNCGACGAQCAFDEFCDAGSCQPICPGQTLCGVSCVDLQTDPLNCGACGNACGSNDICTGGSCMTCRPPRGTACSNECTNTNTDPFNCGGCGNVCDFTDCPSTGTGTCSQGSSCICDESEGASTSSAIEFEPRFRSTRRRVESRALRGIPAEAASSPKRRFVGTRSASRSLPSAAELAPQISVAEAPVCQLPPIQMTLADGESFTQCVEAGIIGVERFTMATVERGGRVIGQGPCAQIVPAPVTEIPEFLPSPVSVFTTDESGDGLCQAGEQCSMYIAVQNLGTAPLVNPIGTIVSPPDAFNAAPVTFLNDTSPYPDFPAFTTPGDCDTPAQLDPQINTVAFTFVLSEEQEGDVGRVFRVGFSQAGAAETMHEMPIVIGVGGACDPAGGTDGQTYDTLDGLQSPVNAHLVPKGGPINFSDGSFNQTKTIPLKVSLACGTVTLDGPTIDPTPQIVALEHETLGPQPLTSINGDNGANPDDPFFHCSTNHCEYQLRTKDLPVGIYVIDIKMPDSRVYQAGFNIRP